MKIICVGATLAVARCDAQHRSKTLSKGVREVSGRNPLRPGAVYFCFAKSPGDRKGRPYAESRYKNTAPGFRRGIMVSYSSTRAMWTVSSWD